MNTLSYQQQLYAYEAYIHILDICLCDSDEWCDVLQRWFSTENEILNIKSRICNKKKLKNLKSKTYNRLLFTFPFFQIQFKTV